MFHSKINGGGLSSKTGFPSLASLQESIKPNSFLSKKGTMIQDYLLKSDLFFTNTIHLLKLFFLLRFFPATQPKWFLLIKWKTMLVLLYLPFLLIHYTVLVQYCWHVSQLVFRVEELILIQFSLVSKERLPETFRIAIYSHSCQTLRNQSYL